MTGASAWLVYDYGSVTTSTYANCSGPPSMVGSCTETLTSAGATHPYEDGTALLVGLGLGIALVAVVFASLPRKA